MTPLQIAYHIIKSYIVVGIMYIHELIYRYYSGNRVMRVEEEEDIDGEVVIVTGASRGMGKAVSAEFAKRGAIVVLGCVDTKEGEETVKEIKTKSGNTNVEMIFLDLADLASVQTFALEVAKKYPKIKILVNNAGIAGVKNGGQPKTKDGFNITMAVNYLGHFLLTNSLLDNLKRAKPSRIVSMSSTMQLFENMDIYDLNMDKSGFGFQNSEPYSNSKYAQALFTKDLGQRLKGSGVTTYALCPGAVKTTIFDGATQMGKTSFKILFKILGFTAEEAASEFILYHAVSKRIAHETGIMYRFKEHFTAANRNLKDSVAKELWDVTANLVQLEERLEAHKSSLS